MSRLSRVVSAAVLGVVGTAAPVAAVSASAAAASAQEKVLPLPIRTDGPKSLDPVEGSTTYDNLACVQVYETLLVNKYSDPMKYEPLLLTEIPSSDDGGLTWRFNLKKGVRFHDDECFPGGRGRELVTDVVFYSIKRIADAQYQRENWWLLQNTIEGLDELAAMQDAQSEAIGGLAPFPYDVPMSGFRKIDERASDGNHY